MAATAEKLLDQLEQWCVALNLYAERHYGEQISDDITRRTDILRLGFREAVAILEEGDNSER